MFMLNSAISADRVLERREILGIFEQLTAQPRKTWISAGTIAGELEAYRASKLREGTDVSSVIAQRVSEYQVKPDKVERADFLQAMRLAAIPFNTRYELLNEYTMRSSETVKYDGRRFHWDIQVRSRNDSVRPDASLAGNVMTDAYDQVHNVNRIFAWDGFSYTLYTPAANHAYVDAANTMPRAVNGPLTAGIIPWGQGRYAYDRLVAQQVEGLEITVNGRTWISLTLHDSDGSTTVVELDPALKYAVLSCTVRGRGTSVSSRFYADFQGVGRHWVPRTIVLESRDAASQRLLERDVWTITRIDPTPPLVNAFDARIKDGTNVEYASPVSNRAVLYQHSAEKDTQALLAQKLRFEANRGIHTQNCATAAIKYAFSQLDVPVSSGMLAGLVTDVHKGSNLRIMKRFADERGLHCRAIRADMDTLENMSQLDDCQMILYLPGKRHFVVLDSIDTDGIRIVDMTNQRFYYRTGKGLLGTDWSTGVALLLSHSEIVGGFKEIADPALSAITGAAEGESCTNLLQMDEDYLCTEMFGECSGYYVMVYQRWGCEPSQSGTGSCTEGLYLRYSASACINAENYGCDVDGDWFHGLIEACE